MELHYQLTAEDFRSCFRGYFIERLKRSGNRRVTILVGVVLLVTLGYVGVLCGADGLWRIFKSSFLQLAAIFVLTTVAVLILYYWFIIPRSAKKQFAELKSAQRSKSVEIDDRGLRFRDEFENALVPWGDVWRWSEAKEGFLLYLSERHVYMLPKRAFQSLEQIAQFRQLLITKIVPQT